VVLNYHKFLDKRKGPNPMHKRKKGKDRGLSIMQKKMGASPPEGTILDSTFSSDKNGEGRTGKVH